MITLLRVPLLLPWVLPPLARRTTERVRPAVALFAITGAAVVPALGVVACLGLLLLPLALRLPTLAGLVHLRQPVQAGPATLVFGAAAPAALAVTVIAGTRGAAAEVPRLRAARDRVAGLPHAGGCACSATTGRTLSRCPAVFEGRAGSW
ncbi:hypothetical protein [Streptomyces siamensis]|uniref:M56 family peptidase n=1 Tax=Streptomyces siamensis TaxID=1274986 RepID=A0ABP9JG21_9ACTN